MPGYNPLMQKKSMDLKQKKLIKVDGKAGEVVYERAHKISPFTADFLVKSFEDVYSIPEIDDKTRETAVIGALTVLGYAIPQLKVHIHAGLNVGLKKDEILAIINTMVIYAGFPAVLNAVYAAQEVFDEHDKSG
jgi:4-carboxymuconolactone decarboxylase